MEAYDRRILALKDDELEQFVLEWMKRKVGTQYTSVERFSGAGDMGRDVVGFLTAAKHQGDWDNYQCKQYKGTVGTATALLELGKVLFYAHQGKFTAPAAYCFVAPRGLNRNLEHLVFNPGLLKTELINNWDKYCDEKIVKDTSTPLTPALRAFIEAYDFSRVERVSVHALVADPSIAPVLAKWFGAPLGPPPKGSVPTQVQPLEEPYLRQLLDAYGERDGCKYQSHTDVLAHAKHGTHLKTQRERFFQTEAFERFYRDNTDPEEIAKFREDIYHGVIETHDAAHPDALERHNAVMNQAATVQPAGPLATYARVPVKQGVCHHLANEDQLHWHK